MTTFRCPVSLSRDQRNIVQDTGPHQVPRGTQARREKKGRLSRFAGGFSGHGRRDICSGQYMGTVPEVPSQRSVLPLHEDPSTPDD
jgi:hypothetical protein